MSRTIDMTKHPRLVRRGNRFYYRRRVPKDLVSQFTPCIRIALRTSDWTLAVALCRRYDADFDIRFAQATARTKPLPALQPLSLSDTDIAAICDRYLADALHTDDESRALGYMQPLFEIFKVGDAPASHMELEQMRVVFRTPEEPGYDRLWAKPS